MKPFSIWTKTLAFTWIRLGLALLTFSICAVLVAVAWFVIKNGDFTTIQSATIGGGAFLLALLTHLIVMSRFGYGIKMGHLAIVERAHRDEPVPENPVRFSKDVIKARFGNTYKFMHKESEISGALRQIKRVLARGFSLDGDGGATTGGRAVRHLICHPALSCVDECCLTYALRRNDYEINAAVADALTILAQNWPKFMSKSMGISIVVYLVCICLFLAFFLPGFYFLQSLSLEPLLWLAVSFFIMMTLKTAFVDEYTLIKTVCTFLDLSGQTTIDKANYRKLDSWSKTYAKIRKKAEDAAEKADDAAFKAEQKAAAGSKLEAREGNTVDAAGEPGTADARTAPENTDVTQVAGATAPGESKSGIDGAGAADNTESGGSDEGEHE